MRMIVLFALLLAGCAEPAWIKPGSTAQQLKTDDKQCEDQAIERAPAPHTVHIMVVYTGCMKDRGWSQPETPKHE